MDALPWLATAVVERINRLVSTVLLPPGDEAKSISPQKAGGTPDRGNWPETHTVPTTLLHSDGSAAQKQKSIRQRVHTLDNKEASTLTRDCKNFYVHGAWMFRVFSLLVAFCQVSADRFRSVTQRRM
jgi:hypothetical protein